MLVRGPRISEKPHKLVLPQNVPISAFYAVILCEMDPNVAKQVNLAQNWSFRPLIRPIIHQQVMLYGPQSANSLHKLLLQEYVSRSGFYTIITGEMGQKVLKLDNLANLAQISVYGPLTRP